MSKPGRGAKGEQGRFPFWALLGAVLAIGLAANLVVWLGRSGNDATQEFPASLVSMGRELYVSNCAGCHGSEGEGGPRIAAPALDGSMHAWHHPDSQIETLIRRGGGRMPAVGPGWSDREIESVLVYMKQWWSEEQLRHQAQVSEANP